MSDGVPAKWYSIGSVGVLCLRGEDSVDLLHRLSTQALADLGEGYQVRSTIFTTSQGKMLDWVSVLHSDEGVLLRTTPERAERLREWIDSYIIMDDAAVEDVSHKWRCCSLQGEGARGFLEAGEVPAERVVVDQGGLWYRGLEAYGERVEGLIPVAQAEPLAGRLVEAGFAEVAEDTLEYLRILAGVPSPQREYRDEINPLELRLKEEAIAWNKGCYIGQEVISRLDSYDKVKRLLMGFSCEGALPGDGVIKVRHQGKSLGRVTSLTATPEGGTVGLAIIERAGLECDSVVLATEEATFDGRLHHRSFWGE